MLGVGFIFGGRLNTCWCFQVVHVPSTLPRLVIDVIADRQGISKTGAEQAAGFLESRPGQLALQDREDEML